MRYLKSVILLLLSAILILGVVGCENTAGKADDPVTINIWHVYGAQTDSPLNDLIDEFNETVGKERGIRLEVTMVSNNKNIHTHILAAAKGEPGAAQLPDIFVAYPNTVLAMEDESILVDHRDYFTEDELSAFIPEFLDDGMLDGHLLVLPVAKSTELLFVNKTAFDRFAEDTGANIEDLYTWEGLYETAYDYALWTDAQTPDVENDPKAMFVHDFHFNYFQVGVESLGQSFFANENVVYSPTFERAWEPYAKAALAGGVWLQDGYATEPLRTGESIVSVASSASVLYFSDEVTYADNTTEKIEMITLPCPTFEGTEKTVMQRGAGMCVVKSTPEREQAAITFLKWLTAPECNTEFAVSTGYMPVTQEAFDKYLPQAIEGITEHKYIELYNAYLETRENYTFYTAPQFDAYVGIEDAFEANARLQLRSGRKEFIEGGSDEALLEELIRSNLLGFQNLMQ